MGGWTVEEYENTSADLTDQIVELMREEAEQRKRALSGKPSSSQPFHVERDNRGATKAIRDDEIKSAPSVVAAGIDPRTGRETVTVTKEDGTVVKHRKIEEGESLIHMMFGKPKSFQNK